MFRLGVKLVLCAACAAAVWAVWPHTQATGEAAAAPAEALAAPKETLGWMGVASCAAMACHNANGPRGSKRSEYSTWAAHDKHAQAFAVLYTKRSSEMVGNLYGSGEGVKPAHEQTLCLKCHASGDGDPQPKGPRFQLSDGVGCESCHGPAEHYLSEHYRDSFTALSADEKWHKYGLRKTKNLSERARLCVGCHVSDAATGKDVNHDLYASGHPRLNFEFAAYLTQYPKHWDIAKEKERYSDYEARVWALGQVACARASLELLQKRAKDAQGDKAPWPEFAEYACFACHKTLKPDSPRQRAGYGDRLPGSLPWGAWPWWTATRYAKYTGADNLKGLDNLRKEMERPRPNTARVQASTGTLLTALDGWQEQVEKRPFKSTSLQGFQKELLADDSPTNPLTWDEATQLYLALEALQRARATMEGRPTAPKFLGGLRDLRKVLVDAFPIPEAPRQRVDSPANFEPAQLKEPLNTLRETLGER